MDVSSKHKTYCNNFVTSKYNGVPDLEIYDNNISQLINMSFFSNFGDCVKILVLVQGILELELSGLEIVRAREVTSELSILRLELLLSSSLSADEIDTEL
ncbi:hypothetical protein BpHYR1_038559 [Brachionus plicatilis]|uniref:Uncharacterized protein n=1 Tax=Brachionus plicatilis TaxID=10195 RepID=A0A3M7R2N1_BRAPC|nr:hypothetical protein BpHYR1_038559 [Brachionus plicatilis]